MSGLGVAFGSLKKGLGGFWIFRSLRSCAKAQAPWHRSSAFSTVAPAAAVVAAAMAAAVAVIVIERQSHR